MAGAFETVFTCRAFAAALAVRTRFAVVGIDLAIPTCSVVVGVAFGSMPVVHTALCAGDGILVDDSRHELDSTTVGPEIGPAQGEGVASRENVRGRVRKHRTPVAVTVVPKEGMDLKKVILGVAVAAVLAVGVGGSAEAAGWLTPTNGTDFTNVNGQNFNVFRLPK